VAREAVSVTLAGLDREQRRAITGLRIRIGALDLFMPDVLKPQARRWRTALRAAAAGVAMPELPPEAAVVLPAPPEPGRSLLNRLGYRLLGPQMLRVDLVERLARHAHEARGGKPQPVVDHALATSLGLAAPAIARLMMDLGFRPGGAEAPWIWRGRKRRRPERRPDPSNAFAALAGLRAPRG
jgi:ATP-dependent RNA helicase SUPV3L1/SUV3